MNFFSSWVCIFCLKGDFSLTSIVLFADIILKVYYDLLSYYWLVTFFFFFILKAASKYVLCIIFNFAEKTICSVFIGFFSLMGRDRFKTI